MQYSVCLTGRASWDLRGDLLLSLSVTGWAAACWRTDGKYHLDWEVPLWRTLPQNRFLSKLIHLDFHIRNPSSFWFTCPSMYPSTYSSTHSSTFQAPAHPATLPLSSVPSVSLQPSIHTCIHLSFRPFFCPFHLLSVCPSIHLPLHHLKQYLSIHHPSILLIMHPSLHPYIPQMFI